MDIHIAYWVNEEYTKYAYISCYSLLKNIKNKNNVICHLISEANNQYKKYFYDLENEFNFFKFQFHTIDDKSLKNIPTSLPHLNSSAFYRLEVDKIIKSTEKIIYLDADTIIVWDISELYKQDLEEKIIGAMADSPEGLDNKRIKEYWLKNNKYFNSWVMLINLKKWKQFQIWDKVLSLLKERKYPNDDQDPLNIVLQDSVKYLDWKYNVTTSSFMINDDTKFKGFWKDYYLDAKRNPTLIHFTWSVKPWNLFCIHPYTTIYLNYLLKLWKFGGIIYKTKLIFTYIFQRIIFILFPSFQFRQKISSSLHKIL